MKARIDANGSIIIQRMEGREVKPWCAYDNQNVCGDHCSLFYEIHTIKKDIHGAIGYETNEHIVLICCGNRTVEYEIVEDKR